MNRPQSWEDCDEDIKQFVLDTTRKLEDNLDDNLIGVYLHGSLAMGSYYRPKSDIDLIIVTNQPIGKTAAKATGIAIARQAEQRPTTGNLELSIITAKTAKEVPVPPPCELHYSSERHDQTLKGEVNYDSNKTDMDLQSHLLYVKQRGICLVGKPIDEVFGEYDWQHFMDSVIDDFDWIVEDEHILETPFYSTLNICRVLQLLSESEHIVHSKDEGGKWGLQNLPLEYKPLIKKALDVYRSSEPVDEDHRRTGGKVWDREELLSLRDYAKEARE